MEDSGDKMNKICHNPNNEFPCCCQPGPMRGLFKQPCMRCYCCIKVMWIDAKPTTYRPSIPRKKQTRREELLKKIGISALLPAAIVLFGMFLMLLLDW